MSSGRRIEKNLWVNKSLRSNIYLLVNVWVGERSSPPQFCLTNWLKTLLNKIIIKLIIWVRTRRRQIVVFRIISILLFGERYVTHVQNSPIIYVIYVRWVSSKVFVQSSPHFAIVFFAVWIRFKMAMQIPSSPCWHNTSLILFVPIVRYIGHAESSFGERQKTCPRRAKECQRLRHVFVQNLNSRWQSDFDASVIRRLAVFAQRVRNPRRHSITPEDYGLVGGIDHPLFSSSLYVSTAVCIGIGTLCCYDPPDPLLVKQIFGGMSFFATKSQIWAFTAGPDTLRRVVSLSLCWVLSILILSILTFSAQNVSRIFLLFPPPPTPISAYECCGRRVGIWTISFIGGVIFFPPPLCWVGLGVTHWETIDSIFLYFIFITSSALAWLKNKFC